MLNSFYLCFMPEALQNKVSQSGLITIDLEECIEPPQFSSLDVSRMLEQGLVLREKSFRSALETLNLEPYKNQNVELICSTDAIIPSWAFLLIICYIQPHVKSVFVGGASAAYDQYYTKKVLELDLSMYQNAKVVLKGCSGSNIPPAAYALLASRLRPIVYSLFYGEPCSTVPLFKNKRP